MSANKISKLILGLFISTVLLSGCSTTKETEEAEEITKVELPVWPPGGVEPARFKYIMTIRDSRDITIDPEAELFTMMTGITKRGVNFIETYGVTAKKGLILVTDRRKNCVHAYDVARRKYYIFGFRREGKLSNPMGIAMDNNFNVYVADVKKNKVLVYDRLGLFQRFIADKDHFLKLTDVSVSDDGEQIVVVDTGGVDSNQHRFVVYDKQGKKKFEVGTRGGKDGEFNLPVASAIGPDGTIYILDAGNHRVQAFDPEGKFLFKFGEVGKQYGQFSRPKAITTDAAGNIYVSDASFGNVQVFNSKGEFLLPIGTQSDTDVPGGYRLPIGIAVDNKNYLYIVDAFFNKMDIIKKLPQAEKQ